jgi:hypothetical protein
MMLQVFCRTINGVRFSSSSFFFFYYLFDWRSKRDVVFFPLLLRFRVK